VVDADRTCHKPAGDLLAGPGQQLERLRWWQHPPIDHLAELRAAWAAGPESGPWRGLINLLADDRPVTAEALAAATRRSVGRVRADIADARRHGVQVDDDGAVVGAALTLRPTPHRFRVRGHDLYTWCGFDALFLPIVLGRAC
jgi:alkylmercury lyase